MRRSTRHLCLWSFKGPLATFVLQTPTISCTAAQPQQWKLFRVAVSINTYTVKTKQKKCWHIFLNLLISSLSSIFFCWDKNSLVALPRQVKIRHEKLQYNPILSHQIIYSSSVEKDCTWLSDKIYIWSCSFFEINRISIHCIYLLSVCLPVCLTATPDPSVCYSLAGCMWGRFLLDTLQLQPGSRAGRSPVGLYGMWGRRKFGGVVTTCLFTRLEESSLVNKQVGVVREILILGFVSDAYTYQSQRERQKS